MGSFLSKYGPAEEDFESALLDYYEREETVNQVLTIAKLFKHFETIDLDEHAFPCRNSIITAIAGLGVRNAAGAAGEYTKVPTCLPVMAFPYGPLLSA